jgi:hypothetical protein
MQRMTHEQVVVALDRVLEFCQQIGLADEVKSSRFLEYRRRLQWLIALPSRRHSAGDASMTDEEKMLLATAQVESRELVGLAAFLETCSPDVLKPKLRIVLGGPKVALDEDHASNQARNFIFELSLAEKFWRAALHPELGEHPDLQCVVNGTTVLIECKRLLSKQKVAKRINEARMQLEQALRTRPQARGIIAVSLSKIATPADTFLAYSNEMKVSAFLGDELKRLAQQTRNSPVMRRLPGSIIGMLFHVMVIAQHRETGLTVVADQINVEPRAAKGTTDYRTVQGLYAAVRAAME